MYEREKSKEMWKNDCEQHEIEKERMHTSAGGIFFSFFYSQFFELISNFFLTKFFFLFFTFFSFFPPNIFTDHPVYKFDDRRIRVNYNNYVKETEEIWIKGPPLPGEGLYQCFNRGSCVSPDVCSCPDGYDGFDCRTPLCRYEQRDNKVSKLEIVGCLNGGLCQRKDTCECILSSSIMHTVHVEVKRFPLFPPYDPITGYMGEL